MKKVVSMFMALVMAFTMGPMVARAEDECVGDVCRLEPDASNTMNSTNSTGWAWCKENPKDCAVYPAKKAWAVTKPVCDKVWAETAWDRGKIADGAVATWNAIKNYNYTQLGENMKWCVHNVGDCTTSVYDGTIEWVGDRVNELTAFKDNVESFYDYDLNNQAKWPFWSMVAVATWPIVKTAGNVAVSAVKMPFTLVMKMFNPCFRAFKSH